MINIFESQSPFLPNISDVFIKNYVRVVISCVRLGRGAKLGWEG